MLEVKDLSKNFGRVQAVKNVSFQVRKGEVFGFLGPNGAGKTTTMRIITCYIPASNGTILVDGYNTVEHDLDVRRRIGYLPEHNPLYADMKVGEYLRYVGEIRGLKDSKLAARLDEMVQVCALSAMIDRPIGQLSKGFRQRVGLAQAMMHNPDLLILDEPSSGLDPNQIVEIRQLIKKIGEQKTVIYCSHILSEVSATCNNILIINNGSVVATGSPAELMAKASTGNRYTARIKADATAVKTKLATVSGITSVSAQAVENGFCVAAITVEGADDFSEKLFKIIVDNGWSMAEFKRETASLEDVFTQLTRG